MSQRRRAQFLLPTSLGLVEYDVLEDQVFLGPAARGGLTADPAPFKEAVLAITAGPDGYAVRALPGEAAPQVNDEDGEGRVLRHGDRIRLGEHLTSFRTEAKPVPAAATTTSPRATNDAGRRAGQGRRKTPRSRPNPWVTAVTLAGALLLLVGVYLTLEYLGTLRAEERVVVFVPEPPRTREHLQVRLDSAGLAYKEIATFEREHPDDFDGAVRRYRSFLRRFPASPEARRTRARISEVVDAAGRAALERLQADAKSMVAQGQFARALESVRRYERHYGATSSGSKVEPLRREVRDAARGALDKLIAQVGPMVAANPRAAHSTLLAAWPAYPPDLAAEITGLMERAIELMKSRGKPPPEPREPREPRKPRPSIPLEPGMHPRDPVPPGDGDDEDDDTVLIEAEARSQWQAAYDALRAGDYAQALEGYTLLSLRHGGSDVYQQGRHAIVAGRFAAKVGAQGPAGLLSVPVEMKRGRLEVEYTFDDAREVQRDFHIEQPFPSDRPVTVEPARGVVRMADASGLFHILVWEPDVRFRARVVAEVAHDFGVLAVAETDEFRAIMLDVNNTLFKLKKGPNAKPQPGHLLWFMGQGVWAAADPDAIGYIKIAERRKVDIQNGDRLTLELIRNGDRCEGSFHGRTDGVNLDGRVKGDDGQGMGAARIGLFTNTGILVVEDLQISGKVDMEWFGKYLKDLVDDTQGPPR